MTKTTGHASIVAESCPVSDPTEPAIVMVVAAAVVDEDGRLLSARRSEPSSLAGGARVTVRSAGPTSGGSRGPHRRRQRLAGSLRLEQLTEGLTARG